MSIEELLKKCDKQINMIGDNAIITLILPGKWGKGDKKRLCKGGPIGVKTVEFEDSVLCTFSAVEVKKFAEKMRCEK